MPDQASAAAHQREHGHEIADINGWQVVWSGLGLLVSLIAAVLLAFGVLRYFETTRTAAGRSPRASLDSAQTPLEPRLQSAPANDLAAYRAEKAALLESYRWIDQPAGSVQIPIERAMQLMVERSAAGSAEPRRSPTPNQATVDRAPGAARQPKAPRSTRR